MTFSLTFFMSFRLFGGKGGFSDTISISLQLLASIYVIASLVSFIATILFFANDGNFENTYFVYLATQITLLIVYLPLALKGLHFPPTKIKLGFSMATALSVAFFLIIVVFVFSAIQTSPIENPTPVPPHYADIE